MQSVFKGNEIARFDIIITLVGFNGNFAFEY